MYGIKGKCKTISGPAVGVLPAGKKGFSFPNSLQGSSDCLIAFRNSSKVSGTVPGKHMSYSNVCKTCRCLGQLWLVNHRSPFAVISSQSCEHKMLAEIFVVSRDMHTFCDLPKIHS